MKGGERWKIRNIMLIVLIVVSGSSQINIPGLMSGNIWEEVAPPGKGGGKI